MKKTSIIVLILGLVFFAGQMVAPARAAPAETQFDASRGDPFLFTQVAQAKGGNQVPVL